jgi:hypothetical protein
VNDPVSAPELIVTSCVSTAHIDVASPLYAQEEIRTDFTGSVIVRLGGMLHGTEHQRTSEIYVERVTGTRFTLPVPFVDQAGNPSSSGRSVTWEDLDRIAFIVDRNLDFILNLYGDFRDIFLRKLNVRAPKDEDIFAWCCLADTARRAGLMSTMFDRTVPEPVRH